MAMMSRRFRKTMREMFATSLLDLVQWVSVFSLRVVMLASAMRPASQMTARTVRYSSRISLHLVGFLPSFYYKHLRLNFMVSGPFVTSVGGTSGVNPEIAADFSGGGFSNYFARPDYQNASVSEYLRNFGSIGGNSDLFKFFKCVLLALTLTIFRTCHILSASGRAYPDISAQAMNFQITLLGDDELMHGTSAATPVHFT